MNYYIHFVIVSWPLKTPDSLAPSDWPLPWLPSQTRFLPTFLRPDGAVCLSSLVHLALLEVRETDAAHAHSPAVFAEIHFKIFIWGVEGLTSISLLNQIGSNALNILGNKRTQWEFLQCNQIYCRLS